MPLDELLALLQSRPTRRASEGSEPQYGKPSEVSKDQFSGALKPLAIQLFQATDPAAINIALNAIVEQNMLYTPLHLTSKGQIVEKTLLDLALRAGRKDIIKQLMLRSAIPQDVLVELLKSSESEAFLEPLKSLAIQLFETTDSEEIDTTLNALAQKKMIDAPIHFIHNGQAIETTLLDLAISAGRSDIVNKLIQHGANIHSKNNDKISPLEKARALENNEILELIEKEALYQYLVELNDSDGIQYKLKQLPSHQISLNDRIKYIKEGSAQFTTLMHKATSQKNLLLLEALIMSGANINIQNSEGNTPLMLALAADPPDPKIIEYILHFEPNLSIPNKKGETAIAPLWALYKLDPKTYFETLLTVFSQDTRTEDTAVASKEKEKTTKEVQNIITKYNAALENPNILLDAIKNQDQRLVELLLRDYKIDINVGDKKRITPLNHAMNKFFKKSEVVFLLKMGAIPATNKEWQYCIPLLKTTLAKCLAQNDIRSAVNILNTCVALDALNQIPEALKKDIQQMLAQHALEKSKPKSAFEKWISNMGTFFSSKPAFDLFKSEEAALNAKLTECLALPALQVEPEDTIIQSLEGINNTIPEPKDTITQSFEAIDDETLKPEEIERLWLQAIDYARPEPSIQEKLYTVLSTQKNALFLGETREVNPPTPDPNKAYIQLWPAPGVKDSIFYILHIPNTASTRMERITLKQALPDKLNSQYLPTLQQQLLKQFAPTTIAQRQPGVDAAMPPATVAVQTTQSSRQPLQKTASTLAPEDANTSASTPTTTTTTVQKPHS